MSCIVSNLNPIKNLWEHIKRRLEEYETPPGWLFVPYTVFLPNELSERDHSVGKGKFDNECW